MAFRKEHELHRRKRGMNLGVSLLLVAFAALMFGLTVVKISNGSLLEGYDHQTQASALPVTEAKP